MKKYINKIDAILSNTEKRVMINLSGKNLIITGGNGCGKTQFLNNIHKSLDLMFNPNNSTDQQRQQQNINHYKIQLDSQGIAQDRKAQIQAALKNAEQNLNNLTNDDCQLEFDNFESVFSEAIQKTLLLRSFEATRQYSSPNNNQNSTVLSMQEQAKQQELKYDTSTTFESYLVTYLNAGYMAFALRQDVEEKNKVDKWLQTITTDLRYLFEDDTLELDYKEKEKIFYVKQSGKKPFTFSQLSSGYSSILKIYSDLLMKVELREIEPKELSGVVIIDEIDAHLHVSLQKKILSFLDNAYPNVQFIVSTHSPFVIQSVDNAVIYDLSKLEQLENLSMYSYEAIIKGLLGVKTTSNIMDQLISELTTLTPDFKAHETRIIELVEQISTSESELDSRSKVALLMGKQAILDSNS